MHELGHWFIARESNFLVGEIKIQRNPMHGYADIYPCEPTPSVECIEGFLLKRIKVLLAGAIFESFERKCKFESVLNYPHLNSDYEKLIELVNVYFCIELSKSKEVHFDDLKDKVFEQAFDNIKKIYSDNHKKIRHCLNKMHERIAESNLTEFLFEKKEIELWLEEK